MNSTNNFDRIPDATSEVCEALNRKHSDCCAEYDIACGFDTKPSRPAYSDSRKPSGASPHDECEILSEKIKRKNEKIDAMQEKIHELQTENKDYAIRVAGLMKECDRWRDNAKRLQRNNDEDEYDEVPTLMTDIINRLSFLEYEVGLVERRENNSGVNYTVHQALKDHGRELTAIERLLRSLYGEDYLTEKYLRDLKSKESQDDEETYAPSTLRPTKKIIKIVDDCLKNTCQYADIHFR